VLVIVIDTLRADHLGCYGYEKTTAPNIDKFAKTGAQFQNAYCQMPTTGPSHASIFTSRYPRNHGVLKNGWILSDTFQTIAETLKSNGYTTSAIISSFVLSSRFGYSQGFDNYNAAFPKGSSTYQGKFWEGRKLEGEFDQRADIATRKAINWMRQNRTGKFFLWVHYFDPHFPYDPPPPYVKDFLRRDMSPMKKIVAKYDGEIRFVDDEIGKLLHESYYMKWSPWAWIIIH
jgi:arylsulfatase A-like enzyme